MTIATFGAGCFWGVEHFFRQVNGVLAAECGYMGGNDKYQTYEQVKAGTTGHAEVVQIEYDESVVSYDELLTVFWQNHNPTTLNMQGADIGNQYRSTIFTHDDAQNEIAQQSKLALTKSGKWGSKQIVTEITSVQTFHAAEEYHQNYLQKNDLPSCHISF